MAFVKLDCGMLNSTTWLDKDARDIFITALLMATPREFDEPQNQIEVSSLDCTGWKAPAGWYGFVDAASLGIISRCGLAVEQGLSALERLGKPEPESRSQAHDGRRLIRIDGGFLVLNFLNYREKDHTAAERQRRYRERQKNNRNGVTSRNITQAEAEAEAEAENLNTSAWALYVEHRKELKAKKLTARGITMAMNKLATLSHADQMKCVETTVTNGWIGLFPDRISNEARNNGSFDTKLASLRARAGLD